MLKHGHRSAPKGSPERRAYDAWRNLRARCKSQGNANYGGRGISFDPAWQSYDVFLAAMGLPPDWRSIERIDNDGSYCRENCKWATRVEQNTNKRNNRLVELDGQLKTVSQWAYERGLRPMTVIMRLDRGWPTERALAAGKFHRSGKFVSNDMTIT